MSNILFIGLDVHKESIEVAIAENGLSGPCGYELHRHLTDKSHICIVVSPSLIPKKPDDKIKTDKRDAMIIQKSARQRLKSFLLRHNIRYSGTSNWSEEHLHWLTKDIVLTNPAQKIVLQKYINTVTESAA